MTDIKWQEPPPDARSGGTKWAVVAAQLRERPNEWALIAHANGSMGNDIRNGRTSAWRPAGHFEAVTRKVGDDGNYDIYARYVGEVSA